MNAADPNSAPIQDTSGQAGAILRLLDRPISAADRAADTELASRPGDPRRGHTTGVLLFRLGEETAALPAVLLRRVTPYARPTPIPHRSTGILRGICNIRGELVLCADLRRLLGLLEKAPLGSGPKESEEPRRMVVIGPTEAPWAFEVDGLVGVERIESACLRPPPVTVGYALAAFTAGTVEVMGRQVTVLDGERVLAGFAAGLG